MWGVVLVIRVTVLDHVTVIDASPVSMLDSKFYERGYPGKGATTGTLFTTNE